MEGDGAARDGASGAGGPPPIEPTSFDLVVLGTGLPESILAAAAASSGRKVLHLDSEDYYGSEWASMTLDNLSSWVKSLGGCNGQAETGSASSCDDLEQLGLMEIKLRRDGFIYSHGEVHEYNGSDLGPSRAYNLDIAGPKLAFSAGPLVNLLLTSGASNYLEFKSIDASYIWTGSGFTSAPASRAELFQDRSLSLPDKRRLMRFFNSVQAYLSEDRETSIFSEEELKAPFVEFLQQQQLPPSIQSIILYAVALFDDDQQESGTPLSATEGLQVLALHLSSIGRFPNSVGAFLYPLYGQGELPQAFCRAAAVNGALYVLRRPVASILIDKETRQYKGIRTSFGQVLYSDKLVLGASYSFSVKGMTSQDSSLPGAENGTLEQSSEPEEESTSRSSISKLAKYICITGSSLHPTKTNILLIFPPRTINETNSKVIRVLQMGSNTSVCPNGKFVVQISTLCTSGSFGKDTLQAVLDILFSLPGSEENARSSLHADCSKPKLLWSAFYLDKFPSAQNFEVVQDRIGVCPPPDQCLDYRHVMASTEKMFHQLFDDEEWFTRTSTPDMATEELADENQNLSNGSLQTTTSEAVAV